MIRRLRASRTGGDPDLRRSVDGLLTAAELADLKPALEIDALGTFCPEPVIRTQNGISEIAQGEVLLLLADDAGVEVDIPAWCISTGNEYLGVIREEGCLRVFVRRTLRQGRRYPKR